MEYGCGTGLLSFSIKDKFARITMVDNSEGMLAVVKEKIECEHVDNMDVFNADFLNSNSALPKTSFDVIYNSMVLYHISDVEKIFSIWYSLLSRPGYLYVADLDSDGGLFHGKEFKGHNEFDRDCLGKIATRAGIANGNFKTVYEIKKQATMMLSDHFRYF